MESVSITNLDFRILKIQLKGQQVTPATGKTKAGDTKSGSYQSDLVRPPLSDKVSRRALGDGIEGGAFGACLWLRTGIQVEGRKRLIK
jgi:hypothetical protein